MEPFGEINPFAYKRQKYLQKNVLFFGKIHKMCYFCRVIQRDYRNQILIKFQAPLPKC